MVKKWHIKLTLFVFLLLGINTTNALEVTAEVDRNPVMLDEAFTLTVTATGSVDRDAFQSDVLLQDFIVGNTSVSSQTQMINFDTTRTTTWRTTLFPKEEGTFVIPALEVEGVSTNPILVRVVPVPTVTTQEQRDFFVTAELASNSVYVQQHVNYTVKLYMATNIERGSLQAPAMDGARIEQVGDDNQTSEIVNGKRFNIVERTYVVIPEQSGEYAIQAPIFSGEVLATNTRQSFGFFNRTRNITRRGPQLVLDVKPIPAGITSAWLPSEFVELNESWPENQSFVVGEPITRTLTLTVAGQTKEQLPDIEEIYPPNIKTYPDQADTGSAQRNGVIVSQRTESTAIIPTEAGRMVMPGVEVPWYNVRTQRTEVAKVPPRTVDVLPASESQTTTAPPFTNNFQKDASETPQPVTNELTLPSKVAPPLLWMALTGLFALLWLITSVAWLRAKSNSKPMKKVESVSASDNVSTQHLLKMIKTGQTNNIQPLLLNWMRERLAQDFTSMHDALSHPKATTIREQYHALTASQFSSVKGSWSSQQFEDAVKQLEKDLKSSKGKNASVLPSLYPST